MSVRLCAGGGEHVDDGGGEGASGAGTTDPVLILGAGWVGSRLARSLSGDDIPVVITRRPSTDVDAKPPYFRPVPLELPHERVVSFELSERATWEGLPAPETLSAVVVSQTHLRLSRCVPYCYWRTQGTNAAAS